MRLIVPACLFALLLGRNGWSNPTSTAANETLGVRYYEKRHILDRQERRRAVSPPAKGEAGGGLIMGKVMSHHPLFPSCAGGETASCLPHFIKSADSSKHPIQTIEADLNHDRQPVKLVLDPTQENTLSFWRNGKPIWRDIPRRWHPWKMMVADVDGDGRQEIIFGLYKSTRFKPKPHNCLFVYDWNGKRLTPRWLGSSLGKSFIDFTLGRLGGNAAHLVALEVGLDGKELVECYGWNGFGFDSLWEQGRWDGAQLMGVEHGIVVLKVGGNRVELKPPPAQSE